MKQILIDTNIYSHAMRGDKDIIDTLNRVNVIGICSISIGELLSGFKKGDRESDNRSELNNFLDAPRVRLYSIDEDTAEFYAGIHNLLREIGRPIPTNDLWIASVAFQYGLKLFTKDRHFREVPGLMLV